MLFLVLIASVESKPARRSHTIGAVLVAGYRRMAEAELSSNWTAFLRTLLPSPERDGLPVSYTHLTLPTKRIL